MSIRELFENVCEGMKLKDVKNIAFVSKEVYRCFKEKECYLVFGKKGEPTLD